MKYPIFIPSKGRATYELAKVCPVLDQSKLHYTIFVEPQDELTYRGIFGLASIVVLKENDKGIGYARQSMLDYAREKKIPVYWQLDDNIYGFYKVEGGKTAKCGAREALETAETYFDYHNAQAEVGLLGLDYQQYAWAKKDALSLNNRTWCSTLTRSDTGIDYAQDLDTREDVDFCLQHLLNGWRTILVHRYAMGKPPMAMNKFGGLSQQYKQGKGMTALRDLVEKYKDIPGLVGTKPMSQSRGLNVKINWRHFK